MSKEEKQHKIKQSETITIKRSQINFAPYNPRKKDPKVVEALKRNFKRVGYLGGIVWNETTQNCVSGHKRLQSHDIIYNYDGTPEKDYDIKVEKVILDEKTEKEQNIFMNSQSVQGKFDYFKLAEMLPTIDYNDAGLSDSDIKVIQLEVPNIVLNSNPINEIQRDMKEIERPYQELKEAVKQAKQQVKGTAIEREQNKETYLILNFESVENKLYFLEINGLSENDKIIKGEMFLND